MYKYYTYYLIIQISCSIYASRFTSHVINGCRSTRTVAVIYLNNEVDIMDALAPVRMSQ